MRNLIVTENLSLDGVMEAPERWAFAYQDADLLAVNQAAMENSDTMLLGRETFEEFAAYWQYQKDEQGFGEKMNRSNKYVVSKTLKNVTWRNSSVISQDVTEGVRNLKKQPGKDIVILGSGKLVQSLVLTNLIDEYRLFVYPLTLGRGKRLFERGFDDVKLKLSGSQTFKSGVVYLRYRPETHEEG